MQLHDSSMAVTWQLYGSYMQLHAVTWQLHGSSMAVTWQLQVSYATFTCQLRGRFMVQMAAAPHQQLIWGDEIWGDGLGHGMI